MEAKSDSWKDNRSAVHLEQNWECSSALHLVVEKESMLELKMVVMLEVL